MYAEINNISMETNVVVGWVAVLRVLEIWFQI
jgi:hypothetical protein